MDDKFIKSRLMHVVSPDLVEPCLRAMVKAALDNGGRDNVTAILARF